VFDEPHFIAKMTAIERRFEEVGNLIVQPEIIGKRTEFAKLTKEHAGLSELVDSWRGYLELRKQLARWSSRSAIRRCARWPSRSWPSSRAGARPPSSASS
jgi:protein subunit release factor A